MVDVHIDYSSLAGNWRCLSRIVGDAVDVAAVVKSDAYGLGAAEVATRLAHCGCRTFFVGSVEEGVKLRSALPCRDCRIIVLHADLAHFRANNVAINAGLVPCLSSLPDIAVHREGTGDYVLHVDTGLAHYGIGEAEAAAARDMLRGHEQHLTLISHLSHAECADGPQNGEQYRRFNSFCQTLNPAVRSLSGSAGVMLGAQYHFDMVRVGDALFGINPLDSAPAPTRPVVTMTARVHSFRSVQQGAAIGYGGRDVAPRDMQIALVRAGYAQGYPRIVRGRRYALLNGRTVRVIGQVSMEYCALDVTALWPHAIRLGDEVELVGSTIRINDVAETAGTVATDLLMRMLQCRTGVQSGGRLQ